MSRAAVPEDSGGARPGPVLVVDYGAQYAQLIARRARETPPGEWIMASPVGEPNYFIRRSYRDLQEGVLPDRLALDEATSSHPVMIQAWAPVTPNVCAFNTAAQRPADTTYLTAWFGTTTPSA